MGFSACRACRGLLCERAQSSLHCEAFHRLARSLCRSMLWWRVTFVTRVVRVLLMLVIRLVMELMSALVASPAFAMALTSPALTFGCGAGGGGGAWGQETESNTHVARCLKLFPQCDPFTRTSHTLHTHLGAGVGSQNHICQSSNSYSQDGLRNLRG